jgi:hypothetical protein
MFELAIQTVAVVMVLLKALLHRGKSGHSLVPSKNGA